VILLLTGKLAQRIVLRFNLFLTLIFFLQPFYHLRVIQRVGMATVVEDLDGVAQGFNFVHGSGAHQEVDDVEAGAIYSMGAMNADADRTTA
jgi:hypothetical protein